MIKRVGFVVTLLTAEGCRLQETKFRLLDLVL
jgi:hypothetical protein